MSVGGSNIQNTENILKDFALNSSLNIYKKEMLFGSFRKSTPKQRKSDLNYLQKQLQRVW